MGKSDILSNGKVWLQMIPQIEPVLFRDPQQLLPVGFCERCGGECYSPRILCPDCGEET